MLLLWLALQTPAAAVENVPFTPDVVRGRLLDALTAAPVVGADCELWTEESDAPAVLSDSATSGLDGAFALRRTSKGADKVRVRAEGYRAETFEGEDVVWLFPADEPVRLRVLDLDGNVIAGARVRSHQSCRHAPPASAGTSDAAGLVVLSAAPQFAEYEVRASGYGARLDVYCDEPEATVYLPRRAEARIRLLDADGRPLSNRRLRQQGTLETFVVTDAAGRATFDSLFDDRELGLHDCAGELAYAYGWPPLEGELVLRPGDGLDEDRDGWPVLRVTTGMRSGILHVEYGRDSVTHEMDSRPRDVRVRPGLPVTVLAQGDEVRRARLAPWSGERELDLSDPSFLVHAEPEAEEVELAFSARDESGAPLAVVAKLSWGGPRIEDADPAPGEALFRIPGGRRYEVSFTADGYVRQCRQGRAGAHPAERIVLARMARVEFRGSVESIELAGEVRTSADGDGWRELDLVPGFAMGRVRFAGRPELRVVQRLEPGQVLVLEEPAAKWPAPR